MSPEHCRAECMQYSSKAAPAALCALQNISYSASNIISNLSKHHIIPIFHIHCPLAASCICISPQLLIPRSVSGCTCNSNRYLQLSKPHRVRLVSAVIRHHVRIPEALVHAPSEKMLQLQYAPRSSITVEISCLFLNGQSRCGLAPCYPS